jgi:hypothetical protein
VLGIPYSPANAAFLETRQASDLIRLTMNTGQTLTYRLSAKERVNRQNTTIFDQSQTGIVLVLLADPSSAGDRLVLYGDYLAEQESAPDLSVQGTIPMNQPAPQGDNNIVITTLSAITSTGSVSAPLPSEWMYLLVDLKITAAIAADPATFRVDLIDPAGIHYAPVGADPSLLKLPPYPGSPMPPDTEHTLTVTFLAPRQITSATLAVQISPNHPITAYRLDFPSTTALTAANLDIVINQITLQAPSELATGQLTVKARFFNSHADPITLYPDDISIIFSPEILEDQFPVGPASQSTGPTLLPTTILARAAVDLEFNFEWHGEPFAGLALGGYRYIAALK